MENDDDDLFSVYTRLRSRINRLTLSLTIVAVGTAVVASAYLALYDDLQNSRKAGKAATAAQIQTLACSVVHGIPNGVSSVIDGLRKMYNCPPYVAPKPTHPTTSPTATASSSAQPETLFPPTVSAPTVVVVEPTPTVVSPRAVVSSPPASSARPSAAPTTPKSCTSLSLLGLPVVGVC